MFNYILKIRFFHLERVCPSSWNTDLISVLFLHSTQVHLIATLHTTSYRYSRMFFEYLHDLYLQTYRLSESNAAACYFRMHWPSWDTEERLNSERWKLTFLYLRYDSTFEIANVIKINLSDVTMQNSFIIETR